MTEAVKTEPIVKEIWIDATPETVFAFFTEPSKITRWLCTEATLDPRPGGINHQTHPGEDGDPNGPYSMQGEFVEVSHPSRVVFTWGFVGSTVGVHPGTSTVDVTFEPERGGTKVRLEHRDVPESAAQDYTDGWTTLLERLREAVSA